MERFGPWLLSQKSNSHPTKSYSFPRFFPIKSNAIGFQNSFPTSFSDIYLISIVEFPHMFPLQVEFRLLIDVFFLVNPVSPLDESSYHQWPFQESKLEVPTICKAYFLGLCKGDIPTKYGQTYGTVPPF